MWEAIKFVSSGVTLVAFLAAVGFMFFRTQSRSAERLIKTASEKDRPKILARVLRSLPEIDARRLTADQQYDLALRQIQLHERALTDKLRAVCFVVAAAALVAGIAVFKGAHFDADKSDGVVALPASASASTKATSAESQIAASSSEKRRTQATDTATSAASAISVPAVSSAATLGAAQKELPAVPDPHTSLPTDATSQPAFAHTSHHEGTTRSIGAGANGNTQLSSRPIKTLKLVIALQWDDGEGATPAFRVPSSYRCSGWSVLLPVKGAPDSGYVSKQKVCTKSVSSSGQDEIVFRAEAGRVFVTTILFLDGQYLGQSQINWIEKGQSKATIHQWQVD